MRTPRTLSRAVAHRAWLAGWAAKDGLAGVVRRAPEGTVALTFDDGPHPVWTGQVLDVLGELGVSATFFCVGRNARAHPELVQRALAEGHHVGSHSSSHPDPAEVPLRALSADYRMGHRDVEAAAGCHLRLFRPPHGHLGFRSAVMVRGQRLVPHLWTVDPEDWKPGTSAADLAAAAGAARSTDVVLLHDWVEQPWAPEVLDRSTTVATLPAVVRSIRDRGLRFTTLPMSPAR